LVTLHLKTIAESTIISLTFLEEWSNSTKLISDSFLLTSNIFDGCIGLDYLLFPPFRYPPLKWGSRFGTEYQRGLFYGSQLLATALAEVAYIWGWHGYRP